VSAKKQALYYCSACNNGAECDEQFRLISYFAISGRSGRFIWYGGGAAARQLMWIINYSAWKAVENGAPLLQKWIRMCVFKRRAPLHQKRALIMLMRHLLICELFAALDIFDK
jgi:hypothetical protein